MSASTSSNTPNKGTEKLPDLVHFTNTVHHEPYDRISPLNKAHSAKGKNVLITGGGTGIGKAISIAFAQARAQSVTILGRREDRLKSAIAEISKAGTNSSSKFLYRSVDLMKREDLNVAFQSIVDEVGKLDVLVSNAGGFPIWGPLREFGGAELMRGFEINVLSAFNAVNAFLSVATPEPTIINMSTGLAHMAPLPSGSSYVVSKAANLKMMDSFAVENPHVHLVNVQPGVVHTELSEQAGIHGDDSPDLPGHFCVWLASSEAKFLKSKFVWANWDVDELVAKKDEIANSRVLTWMLDGVPM